jgi:catabolite regulation protein CreA
MEDFRPHIFDVKNIIDVVPMRMSDAEVIQLLQSIMMQMTNRMEILAAADPPRPKIHCYVTIIRAVHVRRVPVIDVPEDESSFAVGHVAIGRFVRESSTYCALILSGIDRIGLHLQP